MVDKVIGHWKLEKNENFNEFMKAMHVNLVLRQVGNKITSYEEISRDGQDWLINITSTFRNSRLEFKLNEPFEENTLDGRTVTATFWIEDDKLVCKHDPIKEGDVPARYTREVLEDGRLLLTCVSLPTNTIGKRYFQPYSA